MFHTTLTFLSLVLGLLGPQVALAATWSIEADCNRGDWFVDVELPGAGVVDASCSDGGEVRLSFEAGEPGSTPGQIRAVSSLGTACAGAETYDAKFSLKCGRETEDDSGFEVEEELEVEVEREDDGDAGEHERE